MLQRAAVLIGVKKTGGLPTLRGVDEGVDKMRRWTESQPGMLQAERASGQPDTQVPRVTVLTDASGPVTAAAVQEAIRKYVDDGGIEQLIIYFSGHGANVRYNEYWLLSGAPDNPNEAVNVEGSIPLARQCGIPHVVLISDACRTAAASIQSQSVTGSIVFDSKAPTRATGCVDIFYATIVGKPALEISDPAAPTRFEAVYTSGLLDGLGGKAPVTDEEDDGRPVRRVKPWPLKRYLATAIPDLVTRKAGVHVSQTPDAIITSEPEAWLAELTVSAPSRAAPAVGRTRGSGSATSASAPGPPPPPTRATVDGSLAAASQRALRAALGTQAAVTPIAGTTRGAMRGPSKTQDEVFNAVLERTGIGPGAGHFESECGFKVGGTGVVEALSVKGRVDLIHDGVGLVRLWNVPEPATNVLMVFTDGRGALLPAIPGFITAMTYEQGELTNVQYEPSDNSTRWAGFQQELAKLTQLRRVVATAAQLGVFRPETIDDRNKFVDRLRSVKGLDPSMALYAAYALHSLQQPATIANMQDDLRASLKLSLFDIALLAGQPGRRDVSMPAYVYPAVPLLSQGWALLETYGVQLPGGMDRQTLQPCVTNSLWTVFDRPGVAIVRRAITSGQVG